MVPYRGMVIAEKDSVQQYDTFEAQIYVLKKNEGGRTKPITNKYIQQTFCGIWTINGCVLLDEGQNQLIMPGDTSSLKIWLRKPMVLKQGDRFSMREQRFTSLTGVVTACLPSVDQLLSGFNYTPPVRSGSKTEAKQKQSKKT